MLLNELLTLKLPTSSNPQIKGLALDTRKVQPGDLFFACQGTQTHGEIYIDAALKNGAIAILKEAPTTHFEMLAGKIPCFAQPNLSQQLGDIAARFYGYPSHHQHVIGVTGTNGKTSVTHAIAHLLHVENLPCGLLGTLGYGIYGQLQPASRTTPDAIQLQALLAQLYTQQVHNVVMEVSSHGLAQDRVQGIQFETAVFTNLSRDHLDYHHTMTQYGEAKRRLFTWPHLKTYRKRLPHSLTVFLTKQPISMPKYRPTIITVVLSRFKVAGETAIPISPGLENLTSVISSPHSLYCSTWADPFQNCSTN